MKNLIQILLFIQWLFSAALSQEIETEFMPKNVELSFNGIFVCHSTSPSAKASSDNSRFWCQYEIGRVGDEVRELRNFKFFEGDQLLYELNQAPGSDLLISNSGMCAFMDMTHHYKGELTIHFYSKTGRHLFAESAIGASLFGFSSKGNKFGVGNAKYLEVISILDHRIETYEGGDQFDISADENFIAIALRDKARLYRHGNLIRVLKTGFGYPRKVRISSEQNILVIIDKKHLKAYSLSDGNLIFEDTLSGKKMFRDLMLTNGKILAGIQYRDKGISKGILKVYDQKGRVLIEQIKSSRNFKTFDNKKAIQKSSFYKQIPWPFIPFDSVHTVWNYYEQHMSYGLPDLSYLHQGLDIIVPMNEPAYAVEAGVVKCVLTISGYWHWRIAISQEQTAEPSKGWLYAHLIPSTIQFDVGDTVQQFDYLGDIIQWAEDWGHIHFVEIEDSGMVWRYDDNEWGITYNPLLSLQPNTDLIPPTIEPIFEHSKFAFCLNETSSYLDPDSLYGDIDIIAKVVDYIGDSPWQLPAFKTFFWVKKMPEDSIVRPRTLSQVLNHSYHFYESKNYTPYATVIYKRDSLLSPPYWMNIHRDYYHILTNTDGDSLIDLSEKELAFFSAQYPDGDYRIFVEAQDQFGNATVDSMDVKFKNRISGIRQRHPDIPNALALITNYPNPFNVVTEIRYVVPISGTVSLRVFNVLGQEMCRLVERDQMAGAYKVELSGANLVSGIYFCQLTTAVGTRRAKMIVLK